MINLITVTENEIPIIRNLADNIWHEHFPGIISIAQIDYMLDKMYSFEKIKQELAEGINWQLVLFDGIPIGFFSYGMINPGQCKLFKIYLDKKYRGKGVGRCCIEHTIEFARSKNARELLLYVHRKNTNSIRAYETFGFKIIKEEDTDFGNSFILNDYVMKISL